MQAGRGAQAADRHLPHTPQDPPGAHWAPCDPSPEGPPSLGGNHHPMWLVSGSSRPCKEHCKQYLERTSVSCAPSLGHMPVPSLTTMATSCSWNTFPHAVHTPLKPLHLPAGRKGCSDPSKTPQERSLDQHRKGHSEQIRSALKTKPCPYQATGLGVNG